MSKLQTLNSLKEFADQVQDISDRTYLYQHIIDQIYVNENYECACTKKGYRGMFFKGKHICTICNNQI